MKNIGILLLTICILACQSETENMNNPIKDPTELKPHPDAINALEAYNQEMAIMAKSNKELKGNARTSKVGTPLQINAYAESPVFTDWSGKVQVKYFYGTFDNAQAHYDKEVSVSSDYVCVGGAAWTSNVEYGALLVASHPIPSLTGWRGSSKDHHYVDNHTLNVVAIGLKLDGVSPSKLRSMLWTQHRQVYRVSHPHSRAEIGLDQMIVGGGAKVVTPQDYPGNLLTSSRWNPTWPDGFWKAPGWESRSKDHIYLSRADLDAYTIAFYTGSATTLYSCNIPGFGILESIPTQSQPITVSTGYATATAYVPTGYVLSCPGGEAFDGQTSPGRMLSNIQVYLTSGSYSTATTKDHKIKASGTTYAHNIGLRLKP